MNKSKNTYHNYLKTSGLMIWFKYYQISVKNVQMSTNKSNSYQIITNNFFLRWASIAPGQANLTWARSRPRIWPSATAPGARTCPPPSCRTCSTDFHCGYIDLAQILCVLFEILTGFICQRGSGGGWCEQCGCWSTRRENVSDYITLIGTILIIWKKASSQFARGRALQASCLDFCGLASQLHWRQSQKLAAKSEVWVNIS